MSNTMFAAFVMVLMAFIGGGAYVAMGTDLLKPFDLETASPAEKAAYFDKKARSIQGSFKPNYLSKGGGYTVKGDSIALTYNTGMGSVACGTKKDCKVVQCRRYLSKGISEQGVPVTLRYTDNNGRQIGSQTLKPASCKSILKRWEAGAEARKRKAEANKKAMCSDDYMGMKPLTGC